jgi:hypothetical protein
VLLEVNEAERERARKEIHGGKLRFVDWVERLGGVLDSGMAFQITNLHVDVAIRPRRAISFSGFQYIIRHSTR